jgi:hypothetical protein
MTKEDITRLAREAGFVGMDGEHGALKRFAAIVVSFERQRLHEKFMQIHKSQKHSNNYWHFAARKIMEEA